MRYLKLIEYLVHRISTGNSFHKVGTTIAKAVSLYACFDTDTCSITVYICLYPGRLLGIILFSCQPSLSYYNEVKCVVIKDLH